MSGTLERHPECPIQLSPSQVRLYHEQGYLAFENALSQQEIEACRRGLSDIVRKYAFQEERCKYTPPGIGGGNLSGAVFQSKLNRTMFQLEKGFEPEPGDMEALELKVRKFMWFEEEEPFNPFCTTNPRTFGLLETLLGGPVTLYQSMALIKPPFIGVEKPWHQDNAYFNVTDIDGVIGTWIALDDATVENGCMHVLPGGHHAGPLAHHHTSDCEIKPDRFDRSGAVPVELKAGGILIFHPNLPHQTPPNASGQRRRALQFHYRRQDNALISYEEFDKVFAEKDGTPASCAFARRNGF